GVRAEARIFADLLTALKIPSWVRLYGRVPWESLLPSLGYGVPFPRPAPGGYLGRGPRTPGHRVRFWHERLNPERGRLARAARQEDPAGFRVIGRRRRIGHNSWLHGGHRAGNPEESCWMNPEDLAAMGLAEGGLVEIRSPAGALSLPAVATPGLARG